MLRGDMLVSFVTRPSASAAATLDLMTDGAYIDADSWDDTPGQLLGDPEGYGAEYGRRRLSFTWVVKGGFAAARAARALLAREVLRESNWLMFQHDDRAEPCWYSLHRSSPGALSLAEVYLEAEQRSEWTVEVVLECEPFIYGEAVSFSHTFGGDPAIADKTAMTAPSIIGDAPAPLSFAFQGSTSCAPIVSVSAMSSWSGLVVWQGESATMASGAVAVTPSAAASNNAYAWSNNAAGSAATETKRLSFAPVLAQSGTYQLWARLAGSSATATANVRPAGASAIRPRATFGLLGTSWRWVNIGTYRFPVGNGPASSPYTLTPGAVELWGSAASFYLDNIVAIPVTLFEDVAKSRQIAMTRYYASTDVVKFDAESESVSVVTSGAVPTVEPNAPTGVFPRVYPGAMNVVHVLPQLLLVTGSLSVTFTYHPRYLWVP